MKKNGQTLVEVLVAIGVVVTALIGILSIAYSYLVLGGRSEERLIAVFLAREGLELVRNIRDSNWLNPYKFWPYSLENGNFIIDASTNTLTPADSSEISSCNNCKLYLSSNNFYLHEPSFNSPTPFKRMIVISKGDDLGAVCPDTEDGCEKKIRSIVYWIEHDKAHQIFFELRLTNWR
jgi:type II secretory pathway pseudopilin PulG